MINVNNLPHKCERNYRVKERWTHSSSPLHCLPDSFVANNKIQIDSSINASAYTGNK